MQGAVFIIIAAVSIFVIYLLMNKKGASTKDREGVVKEVLSKHTFVVEFDDRKSMVVKLNGITPASENEMMDDQIFEFLNGSVLSQKVLVKPVRVDVGEILVAGVYSLAGEYINELIVRQGFARWAPSEAPNEANLREAQEKAQSDKVGVWNPAVRQLVEEKMKKAASGELDESDLEDIEKPSGEES